MDNYKNIAELRFTRKAIFIVEDDDIRSLFRHVSSFCAGDSSIVLNLSGGEIYRFSNTEDFLSFNFMPINNVSSILLTNRTDNREVIEIEIRVALNGGEIRVYAKSSSEKIISTKTFLNELIYSIRPIYARFVLGGDYIMFSILFYLFIAFSLLYYSFEYTEITSMPLVFSSAFAMFTVLSYPYLYVFSTFMEYIFPLHYFNFGRMKNLLDRRKSIRKYIIITVPVGIITITISIFSNEVKSILSNMLN